MPQQLVTQSFIYTMHFSCRWILCSRVNPLLLLLLLLLLLSVPLLQQGILCIHAAHAHEAPFEAIAAAATSSAVRSIPQDRSEEVSYILHSCCPYFEPAVAAFSLKYSSSNSTDKSSKTKNNAKIGSSTLQPFNALVACINRTISDSWASYPARHLDLIGPTKTISILTRATSDIFDYSGFSLLSQAIYASRRGYSMIPLFADDNETNAPKTIDFEYFPKVSYILRALTGHSMYSNYVIWMDADLVILDFDLAIEELIYENPQTDIFISADVSSFVNTGMMVFKNSMWTIRFLQKWLSFSSRGEDGRAVTSLTDQMGFEAAYRHYSEASKTTTKKKEKRDNNDDLEGKGKDRDRDKEKALDVQMKIKILPPHVLNSEASPLTRLMQSHKVLHLAAEHNSLRGEVFSYQSNQLCRLVQPINNESPVATTTTTEKEVNSDGNNVINVKTIAAVVNSDSNRVESAIKELGFDRFGITRRYLQVVGNEIYFRLALRTIQSVLKNKPFSPAAMDTLYEMRQSVSKYTHTFRLPFAHSSSTSRSKDQNESNEGDERRVALSPPILYVRVITSLMLANIAQVRIMILKLYDHNFSKKLANFKSLGSRNPALGNLVPLQKAYSRKTGLNGVEEVPGEWIARIGSHHKSPLASISLSLLNESFSRLVGDSSGGGSSGGINRKDWDFLNSLYKEKLLGILGTSFDDKVNQNTIDTSLRKLCKFKGTRDEDSPQVYIQCVSRQISEVNAQLPELLKLSAELHFELLSSLYTTKSSSSSSTSSSRTSPDFNGELYCLHEMECSQPNHTSLPLEIANYLFVVLDILEYLVSEHQRHIVLDMRASLLSLVGQFYLSSSASSGSSRTKKKKDKSSSSLTLGLDFDTDIDQSASTAMDYLLASLSVYEQELRGSFLDNRAYVQTISMLATARCSSRQYISGLASFQKAIELETGRLGITHFQLIEKYANAGFCAADMRDSKLAGDYFRKALSAIEANPGSHLGSLEMEIKERLAAISHLAKKPSDL